MQWWSNKINKNTNKANKKIQARCSSQGLARLKLRCWTELRFILRLLSFPNSTIVGRIWFCVAIAPRAPLSCWLSADVLLGSERPPFTRPHGPVSLPRDSLWFPYQHKSLPCFQSLFFQEGPSQDNLPFDELKFNWFETIIRAIEFLNLCK